MQMYSWCNCGIGWCVGLDHANGVTNHENTTKSTNKRQLRVTVVTKRRRKRAVPGTRARVSGGPRAQKPGQEDARRCEERGGTVFLVRATRSRQCTRDYDATRNYHVSSVLWNNMDTVHPTVATLAYPTNLRRTRACQG